jgi:hypothetical protein
LELLEVDGPFEVGFADNGRSKLIEAEDGRAFFDENVELADRRGCYVFAVRSGRGLRAAYVGKATRSFEQEVFSADKLQKYNVSLHKWPHGTPVLLFVVTSPRVRSPKLITEVEEHLIREAKRGWPELLNKHHTGPDAWDICGVTAEHRGRRSSAELALLKLLKYET